MRNKQPTDPPFSMPWNRFPQYRMNAIGIDLGGSSIKVCKWNANERSTSGIGAEIVFTNRGERCFP